MSFFIYTSAGIINRDQITSIKFKSHGVWVGLSDSDSIYLTGDEAFLFTKALIPSFSICSSQAQTDFMRKHVKHLEDAGSKVASTVASKSKGGRQQ